MELAGSPGGSHDVVAPFILRRNCMVPGYMCQFHHNQSTNMDAASGIKLILASAGVIACILLGSKKKSPLLGLSPSRPIPTVGNQESKWKPLEYSVLFGVVGGLGPQAMAYFIGLVVSERCRMFTAMSKAKNAQERLEAVNQISPCVWTRSEVEQVWDQTRGRNQLIDQDHVPILAAQATTVPPRPKFILKESPLDPTPQLVSVANGLAAAGATHLAVICNTAHYFWPTVKMCVSDAECVDMVKLTLAYVARISSGEKVGIFATTATLQTGMYQLSAKKEFSLHLVSPMSLPDGNDRQKEVERVIFSEKGIKSGYDNPDKTAEACENLKVLLQEALILKRQLGCNTIILGCSELPLLLNLESLERYTESLLTSPEDRRDIQSMKFVDPGHVLAHEILHTTLLSRERRDG